MWMKGCKFYGPPDEFIAPLIVHNPLETVVKDQDMSTVYSKLTNRSHRDR